MNKKARSRTRVLEALRHTAADLNKLGFITKRKMQKYDAMCIPPVPDYDTHHRRINLFRMALKGVLVSFVLGSAGLYSVKAAEIADWTVSQVLPYQQVCADRYPKLSIKLDAAMRSFLERTGKQVGPEEIEQARFHRNHKVLFKTLMQTECLLFIEDLQRLDDKTFLDETKRQWITEDEARLLATPTKSTGAAFRKDGRPAVLAVAENSPAQKAGLQAGDVITALNGRQISSVADLTVHLAAATARNQTVKFAVRRTTQTLYKKISPWRGHAAWTFPSLLSGKNTFFEQLILATALGPRHRCGIAYPDLNGELDSSFNEFIKNNTAHYSVDEWRLMEPLAMQGDLTKKECEEYKEALSSARVDDLISESREEALRSEKIEQIITLNGEERSGIGIRLLGNRKEPVIERVSPNSSASRAGLKTGDVIVDMNGSRVASASDLVLRILLTPPGEEIILSVVRDNNPMRAVVQVETIN